MKPEPIFNRWDWWGAVLVVVAAMGVYAYTAAPGVTLLDSGEFLTAAVHFGVPHPTGYPLWTLLAWLWQNLPLGHPAWEVALFSGLLGAMAAGLLSALGSSALRWIFPHLPAPAQHLPAMVLAGCFALSESVWSQAVIAEVYTLHALLSGLFLFALYTWVRRPEAEFRLFLSFFFLALAFSNHHLALVWTPLPFLAVLLLRRDLLPDLLLASLLTAVLFYLGFGLLGKDYATLKTSVRLTWLVLTGLVIFSVVRRGHLQWKWIAYLPLAIGLGLSPYVYLPVASGTNPPMNWGYTRTTEGFYGSVNRSQYGGSLDEQLVRLLGKVTGTASLAEDREDKADEFALPERGRLAQAQLWIGFFWARLMEAFTPVGLLCFLLALGMLRGGNLPQRTWMYLLMVGFFLAAFLQPTLDGARIDLSGWWLQRPFHTYTNFAVALVMGLGGGVLLSWWQKRQPSWVVPLAWLSLGLLVWPAWFNHASSTQRGHWWGWLYGREMLADLPEGAVVFGGTDPGRFVPTWMIFGESMVPAKWKKDPDFDRRDLYIITQNALVDPFYLNYLRDHYTNKRPEVKNGFERWLGRAETYPEKPLVLPDEEWLRERIREGLEKGEQDLDLHASVAEYIFSRNNADHEFFVEESFPMEWTYRHGEPSGFLLRLQAEELSEIGADVVERDFAFWDGWLQKWENDPPFLRDFDARRSFAKLRVGQANLYRHREMKEEARRAYGQALQIDPTQTEALLALSNLEWDAGNFDEVIQRWRLATALDPNNDYAWYLRAVAERRKEKQEAAVLLEKQLETQPDNADAWQELVAVWLEVLETEKAASALGRALEANPENRTLKTFAMTTYWQIDKKEESRQLAERWTNEEPDALESWLALAALQKQMDDEDGARASLQRALQVNEIGARHEIRQNPVLRPLLEETALPGPGDGALP